jgi:serine/threonine-protein kinase
MSPRETSLPSEEHEIAAALPAQFGSYLLLHQIARGGMGDVFLAKTGGNMGIEKHCVVKTLRDRFTDDEEYVGRFVEEARLVVQLSHRNICQVFDVGRVDAAYYLGMELVLGRDVRSLQISLVDRGLPLSEAIALHIACEMLEALDYAHRHVDPTTGQPLHIVHRDVSPQNVLINFEGEVKLIDFGLAERGRALTAEVVSTGERNVMGKIAYMAPEHARGEVVDARADQFAAGVMLYELLTSERYYSGRTPQQVWSVVGTGQYEPAKISTLSPELQRVLRRALAGDKRNRYESCGDFRDELLEIARVRGAHGGGRALRQLMNELFADDLRQTREMLQRAAKMSTPPSAFAPRGEPNTGREVQSFASVADTTLVHDPTEAIPRTATVSFETAGSGRKRTLIAASLATATLLSLVLVVGFVSLRAAAPSTIAPAPAPATATAFDAGPSVPTTLAAGGPAHTSTGSTTTTTGTATPGATAASASTGGATATTGTATPGATAASASTAGATTPGTTPASATMPSATTTKTPRKPTLPAAPTAPTALTLTQKIAALKRCSKPCAPELTKWEGKLGNHPDVAAFKSALEACFRSCTGR